MTGNPFGGQRLKMREWSSSSDSDSGRRTRIQRRLNDERGVIKREAWADASGTDSSSGAESEEGEEIPLAQTAMHSDASDSDAAESDGADSGSSTEDEEETEDVDIRSKPAEQQKDSGLASDDGANGNEGEDEDDADAEGEEENGEDEEETEDVDIRIKAETPPAEESTAGDGVEEDAYEDSGVGNENIADDDEDDDGDGSASTRTRAAAVARKARSGRARARKAADDSESEWTPGEDDNEEETKSTVPTRPSAQQRKSRKDDENDDDGDEEEDELETEVEDEEAPEPIRKQDFKDANFFLFQLKRTHLPYGERAILWDGGSVSGPPVDKPVSQTDQWRRKYRWPVAMRNVRRRNFVAQPEELSTVYNVPIRDNATADTGPSPLAREAFAAALAPTVRPLMETALVRSLEHSRKRRREAGEGAADDGVSADGPDEAVDLSWLRTVSRLGAHYSDQLLESILVKNVLSLQGIDASYPQQCWDPLPTSKRPVANWKFVLEHFCKNTMHSVDAPVPSPSPKLRKDTLIRIRDRLRTLYSLSWRPEDDEFFNLVDRQEQDPPDLVDTDILQL